MRAKGYGDPATGPGALRFAGETLGSESNHHGCSRWPKSGRELSDSLVNRSRLVNNQVASGTSSEIESSRIAQDNAPRLSTGRWFVVWKTSTFAYNGFPTRYFSGVDCLLGMSFRIVPIRASAIPPPGPPTITSGVIFIPSVATSFIISSSAALSAPITSETIL